MRFEITLYALRPTEIVQGTGPPDDDGHPTVTAEDIAKAFEQERDGVRQIFGRAQAFLHKRRDRMMLGEDIGTVDKPLAFETRAVSNLSAEHADNIVKVLNLLRDQVVEFATKHGIDSE